jgi:malonate-semialdehyde dehydrogenase (acetylating)/methylmalonate-semialdehyde dehydrogenase
LVVDGRPYAQRQGFFLGPTLLDDVAPTMAVAREEIFGPVLSVSRVANLDEAIDQVNAGTLGNMAVIFTKSGKTARTFRERAEVGMVGVNVAVAQPFAFYPFSGWKSSFFGDLHVQGSDGIDFYTRKKMVVSRW